MRTTRDMSFDDIGIQSQMDSCLHERTFDLEDRTNMRKKDTRRMSGLISECLQDCESCEATEQSVYHIAKLYTVASKGSQRGGDNYEDNRHPCQESCKTR